MKISVITPTAGSRGGLLNLLIDSLALFLKPGDEHIVVWDTPHDKIDSHSSQFTRHFHYNEPGSTFGNAQRDFAVRQARGDCLVWCDDDDLLCNAGIEKLHSLPPEPGKAHVFTMLYPGSIAFLRALPAGVRPGRIGGPQLVMPRGPLVPRWMDNNTYMADWHVIKQAVTRFQFEFHPQLVLPMVRPFDNYLPPECKMEDDPLKDIL